MRTLRLSLAGTVILALLGGLGGTVVAQEDEEGSIVGFTMKQVDWNEDWSVVQVEASDPRLSGTWTWTGDCREGWNPTQYHACAGFQRVENEGGTWLGRDWSSGIGFGGVHTHFVGWAVLEGQGEYAGLTAFKYFDEEKMGDDPDIDGGGIIFDFDLPPFPEPLAE